MTIVEEERKVSEFHEGRILGDIALQEPEKKRRALSAMAKTDSICLILD